MPKLIRVRSGKFLSTPSVRRATQPSSKCSAGGAISIHALREEGDCTELESNVKQHRFLSTPSVRRATTYCFRSFVPDSISIHALREEGDRRTSTNTTKCWISIHALREEGDIADLYWLSGESPFLSTPSVRRATSRLCRSGICGGNFYPRPP